jgi:hypothetical protein
MFEDSRSGFSAASENERAEKVQWVSVANRLEVGERVNLSRGFCRRIHLAFLLEDESASSVDLLTQRHSYVQAIGQ